ncbi:MAG: helix-turn-helix domain-containing protein [Clostridiales bacterium]|nr:helix-turn-helix domain-containing protein [Clostridiales bacterium]
MLKNLKNLREETGTTQRQLAEAVSVSQQSVNKYENHNIEPDIETLIRIADFFNTSIDYLVGYSQIRRKNESVTPFDLTERESNLINKYRQLDRKKKSAVDAVVESFFD